MSSHRFGSAACVLTLLLSTACWSQVYAAKPWVEVKSPHFTVFSNAGEKKAASVAMRFERIREVIQQALPSMNLDPGQPIVVFAVSGERSFRELLPQFYEHRDSVKPAGIFLRGPERHFVALRLDLGGDTAFHTVFHEYIHLLTSLNLPDLPLWLNEGLAEFYAHAQISGSRASLGLPSEGHVQRLRRYELVPLPTLFAIDPDSPAYSEADKATIFYAQSWALTHYLILEESNDGVRPLDRYLGAQANGTEPSKALEEIFGSLDRLEGRLREYVDGDRFRYVKLNVPSSVERSDLRIRSPRASEIDAWEAAFLIRNQRFREARAKLAHSLQSNPNEALAYEGLGYLHFSQGRQQEALRAFSRAVELDSESYLSHYYFAVLSLESDATLDARQIEESLRRSISIRPSFPHAHSALAHVLLKDEARLEDALSAAIESSRLEPRNVEFLNILGYALLKLERVEEALEVAGDMETTAGTREEEALARGLRDSIQQMKELSAARLGPEDEGYPSVAPRTLYEAVEHAEKIEGIIVESGCSPQGALSFTVENADGNWRFAIGNLGALTYFFAGQPPERFDPCRELSGRPARVAFVRETANGRVRPISVILLDSGQ